MTIDKEGIINLSARKLADRMNEELEGVVGIQGITASADDLNILTDTTATTEDLDAVHANIAEIQALTNTPVAGVMASESRTAILGELASRVVALENTPNFEPIVGVIASDSRSSILTEIINRVIALENA